MSKLSKKLLWRHPQKGHTHSMPSILCAGSGLTLNQVPDKDNHGSDLTSASSVLMQQKRRLWLDAPYPYSRRRTRQPQRHRGRDNLFASHLASDFRDSKDARIPHPPAFCCIRNHAPYSKCPLSSTSSAQYAKSTRGHCCTGSRELSGCLHEV